MNDDMRVARGFICGTLIGAALWTAIILGILFL